ncbi:hypothetical protein LJC71_01285 [Desulfosarcina sp. OttesenSCG-928-A07]|nr:hypothetical protein [Desulfosarcina sp. OttesenSCG-928-G17]MDL2328374.1 hypothetical protein [Desulfosarcina sp. OttesenSCG-928-A07]
MNTEKRSIEAQKKQSWALVEELMNRYFEDYDEQYREQATALLWKLSLHAFVQHVRKKGATTGYTCCQGVGWEEKGKDDGWEMTTQSLLTTVFRRDSPEALVKKYQAYRDSYNESGVRSISFQRWMVQRLWWRMQDRWEMEKEKKDPACYLSKKDPNFDHLEDEADPAQTLVEEIMKQVELEEDEKSLLDCFCDDLTRKAAAEKLGISEGAYRYRLDAVFKKLKDASYL